MNKDSIAKDYVIRSFATVLLRDLKLAKSMVGAKSSKEEVKAAAKAAAKYATTIELTAGGRIYSAIVLTVNKTVPTDWVCQVIHILTAYAASYGNFATCGGSIRSSVVKVNTEDGLFADRQDGSVWFSTGAKLLNQAKIVDGWWVAKKQTDDEDGDYETTPLGQDTAAKNSGTRKVLMHVLESVKP